VEEQLGGRVGDREHPVPLRPVRVVELELELTGVDGVPEGGGDVAAGGGAAVAAEDGDLVVLEGGVGVLRVREAAEPGRGRAVYTK
jgi:hypothetical protein